MTDGARTPEELEALFEDAFMLRDFGAVAHLFEVGAVLVAGGGLRQARGRQEIVRLTTEMWDSECIYLSGTQRVLQAGDAALVLGGHGVNMVRRGHDRSWRYVISFLNSEPASKGE
ncbi:MAG: hypothetical protein ACR2G7_09090 [Acidimicrobiales bacterium]